MLGYTRRTDCGSREYDNDRDLNREAPSNLAPAGFHPLFLSASAYSVQVPDYQLPVRLLGTYYYNTYDVACQIQI